MRLPIYTVAVPLLVAVGFAQDSPQKPQQSTDPAGSTATDKSAKTKDKAKDTTSTMAANDHPAEMKTQTYSGTLVDASCAGSGAASGAGSSGGSTATTSTSATPASTSSKSASADRAAAPPEGGQSCSASASTTKFALKTKDGQTLTFDDVGNLRTQEAFKNRKKWSDSASANKPLRVKASGVVNGDRLTVMSIN